MCLIPCSVLNWEFESQRHVGWCADHSLIRLDLSDNPLTSDVAESLAAAIKEQRGLKELILNDTSLCDEGIAVLAEALPSVAPSLEVLQLALNEVLLPPGFSS